MKNQHTNTSSISWNKKNRHFTLFIIVVFITTTPTMDKISQQYYFWIQTDDDSDPKSMGRNRRPLIPKKVSYHHDGVFLGDRS